MVRVRVGPGTEPLQRFFQDDNPGRCNWAGFTTKNQHLNLTNLAPVMYWSSDRIATWSVYRLSSITSSFTSRFQIYDPTNIRGVAIENPRISLCFGPVFTATHRISVGSQNLNAGGERACKTAHSMYWSCHNTIRTQILNWSQSCRNRKFGTAVWFQPGQIPAVLCPGRVTTRQAKRGSGFWPGLEPNRTEPPVKTRTAGGLPGPVANTNYQAWLFDLASKRNHTQST